MRRAQREALRARYDFRCGYCGIAEIDAGGELTVDHFQPRSREGAHSPENWVYACITCNDFKGDVWRPELEARILHPLRDELSRHLQEGEDGQLMALTPAGRYHIDRLQLNRPQLIRHRQRREQMRSLRERLARLEQENAGLLQRIRVVEEQVRELLAEAEREIEP